MISQRAVFGHALVGGQVVPEVEPGMAFVYLGGSGRSSRSEASPYDPARAIDSLGARLPRSCQRQKSDPAN